MNANNLHFVWIGKFRVALGDYQSFRLEFNAPDMSTANITIQDFVIAKEDKGWRLIEGEVDVSYNQ